MVYFGYSHVRNILIEKCGKKKQWMLGKVVYLLEFIKKIQIKFKDNPYYDQFIISKQINR